MCIGDEHIKKVSHKKASYSSKDNKERKFWIITICQASNANVKCKLLANLIAHTHILAQQKTTRWIFISINLPLRGMCSQCRCTEYTIRWWAVTNREFNLSFDDIFAEMTNGFKQNVCVISERNHRLRQFRVIHTFNFSFSVAKFFRLLQKRDELLKFVEEDYGFYNKPSTPCMRNHSIFVSRLHNTNFYKIKFEKRCSQQAGDRWIVDAGGIEIECHTLSSNSYATFFHHD